MKALDSDGPPASSEEEEGERGQSPRIHVIRADRFGPVVVLAQALWDLHAALVSRASSTDELQVLGDWWDEHKTQLERILRKTRRNR